MNAHVTASLITISILAIIAGMVFYPPFAQIVAYIVTGAFALFMLGAVYIGIYVALTEERRQDGPQ
jgi:hypothetical protein